MGLFRPYERTTPDAPTTRQDETKAASRISSLTPKGEQRSERRQSGPVVEAPATVLESSAGTRVVTRTPQKKQGATPTRRQAEAERMQRLHPNLSKADERRANRDSRYKARAESWDKVENAPERVLLRDFVDTRWTVTEFMLPVMLLLMAGVVGLSAWPSLTIYPAAGLWLMMGMSFINTGIMWARFKTLLAERLPNANKRGLLMYMFNRSLMIRRFRRPGPRVVRGASI